MYNKLMIEKNFCFIHWSGSRQLSYCDRVYRIEDEILTE